MSEPVILTVTDYLALVNKALAAVPRDLLVEGEVSDLRVSHGKWVSFDVKDEGAQAVLKCFMTAWQMHTPIEDGMRVRVSGRPTVSARFGKFQLNVDAVEPVGEGALKRAYELLKAKLRDEGVFDAGRKRPIPRFPERIGLITSRDAAAYGDFLRVLGNRWGGVRVDFTHVHVQGREAVPEILEAFAHFNRLPEDDRPDVLVLVRGGGGLEDLHAFNDEQVVRAVFQARIPVIVGVGHERDESLCDFAADMRASTPSNAAERAVPNRREVQAELEASAEFMAARLRQALAEKRHRTETAARGMAHALRHRRDDVARVLALLHERVGAWLPPLRERLAGMERLLKNVDPARVLARGYAIVRTADGTSAVLSSATGLVPGQAVSVQLARGSFDARVERAGTRRGQQSLV